MRDDGRGREGGRFYAVVLAEVVLCRGVRLEWDAGPVGWGRGFGALAVFVS